MKWCYRCRKNRKFFNANVNRKDGLQRVCRECQKELSNNLYERSAERRAKIRESNIRRRIQIKIKILEYLVQHPCSCGESNPILLEFDHIRGAKIANVSEMWRRYSWKKIQKEMEKCEVRCIKCHRLKTARTQNWYASVAQERPDLLPS